ncbi:hypothetical protein [Halopiger goleimassiliensis]|uniref:hypothetical protein n=1 Tax=Halopiger goleimassiliensis TaxID=1293048 RepID=UPI0009DB96F2|nr:hypothetical protein [Halopiger goleimassiliensis]
MTTHPALVTALDRIAVREGRERTALGPSEAVDPGALPTPLESTPDGTGRFADAAPRRGSGPLEVAVPDARPARDDVARA